MAYQLDVYIAWQGTRIDLAALVRMWGRSCEEKVGALRQVGAKELTSKASKELDKK